jgi:two-component sensor histidine kinase
MTSLSAWRNSASARRTAIVVWVLLAIFVSRAILFLPGPPNMNWQRMVARLSTDLAVWLALAPFIVWLSRRFPFDRHTWGRALLVHLPAAFIALALHALVRLRMGAVIMWMPKAPLSMLMYAQAHINFLTYWAIVAATHGFDYYTRYRDREQRAAQLEAELARAQLDALTRQLQPHFLFNTMNAISAFMHEDVERADRMLGSLGDLLRTTLQQSGVQEIPLREELAFLDRYLEIQTERFGERLEVKRSIDANVGDALVPPLILQPIVENALQHGIANRLEGGTISISAQQCAGRLDLRVSDDGGRVTSQAGSGFGIGMSNSRQRLQHLYGSDYLLDLRETPHSTEVIINIPFKT